MLKINNIEPGVLSCQEDALGSGLQCLTIAFFFYIKQIAAHLDMHLLDDQ
jgi:hypothetical protein